MSFHYRYRKQILICIIIFILISIPISYFIYKELNKPKKKEPVIKLEKKEEPIKEKETIKYFVDIKGEINNPGIYEMDINSRVIDVINIAGGLTNNANTSVINLSKKITDEMVIIVYSNKEVEDFTKTKEKEEVVINKCIEGSNGVQNNACITKDNNTNNNNSNININTATLEELMSLPGIGESKAKSIIEYRNATPFKQIEDIKNITGIGDNLYAQIKDFITT